MLGSVLWLRGLRLLDVGSYRMATDIRGMRERMKWMIPVSRAHRIAGK